ncbi:MAG: hypothetical protein CMN57_00615 [Gammaproteobacteria bacterium]|nr:hypothetical protein [Gammaproteobacteria bacterium]
MATVGLLALLDDITTLLDDIAVYSKLAAKNTAGVLGDDLALNAQQVGGIRAERELPVVWAVARGSLLNKLILVPAALLISAFLPWLVTPLLMLGGLYLCYEGVEKLAHRWLQDPAAEAAHQQALVTAAAAREADVLAVEQAQIRGAIRTDFILSAEIIVIALGAAQQADLLTRTAVVALIALVATVGVYGLVAAIVKLDDAGLALLNRAGPGRRLSAGLGRSLLFIAPRFMRLVSVLGMAAMFLVGGGILVHGLPFLHHALEGLTRGLDALTGLVVPWLLNAGVGIIAGTLPVGLVFGARRLWGGAREAGQQP